MSAVFELSQDPAYGNQALHAPATAMRGAGRPVATPVKRDPFATPRQLEHEPGAKNSMGCIVVPVPDGLGITSVKPNGWCWSCGLEVNDIILSINEGPARSPTDLRNAIQDPNKQYVVLTTTTPTGGHFRFCLPLPLGDPEMHCMGLLFEQDPKLGFHVVVGLLRNSAAQIAGVVRGCCIRKIDGFPIHGRKEADIRKLMFGGFEDECVLSIQLPGAVELQDVYIPRMQVRLQAEEGDDAWYCDGWSEKQFDMDQAASKCVNWIGNNSLDLAGNDQGGEITGEFPWAPAPEDYDQLAPDVDAAGSRPQVLQPPSSSSGGWELGEEGSSTSREIGESEVKAFENGQATGKEHASVHAGLADGSSRAIGQQRNRDQPRLPGPLSKAGGEPEVAGGGNAIARDKQGPEAYALQAMDIFIQETFSNVRATHEGNLQRFNDTIQSTYDALGTVKEKMHDDSRDRSTLRSAHLSLEAQLGFLDAAILEATRRSNYANYTVMGC